MTDALLGTALFGVSHFGELTVVGPAPPIISAVLATPLDPSSVRITWSTDIAADSRVDYGLTTSYGSFVTNASSVMGHLLTLTGLTAGVTYHYRPVSSAGGLTTTGTDATFLITVPVPPPPPPPNNIPHFILLTHNGIPVLTFPE